MSASTSSTAATPTTPTDAAPGTSHAGAGVVDQAAALGRLMRFLQVEGITGQEAAIAQTIRASLLEAGVPTEAIRFDTAHTRIPVPTQTGNLLVHLPGTAPGPHRLFSTHMDTVPLCAGAKPVVRDGRIIADSPTALGGDNRTGCAVLVTLAATLIARRLPHPPITLLFTVREESGLYGARHLTLDELNAGAATPIREGYNVDGKRATDLTIAAVGAERWEVEIFGKAAHAGVAPEEGISATLLFALALAEVHANGWFGKVRVTTADGQLIEGTSNVGVVAGRDGRAAGDATNVVTDYVFVRGESRSHDPRSARAITSGYESAFAHALAAVTDHTGAVGRVDFRWNLDYHPFALDPNLPVVRRAMRAVETLGLTANLKRANGGLDANWLVRHGINSVTFGAGQYNIHTIDEYVDLNEFATGCELAVLLATMPE